MNSKQWIVLLAAVLLLAGCGGQGEAEQAGSQETLREEVTLPTLDAAQQATAEKAAAIANAIQEAPENTAAILEQYEMSAEDFEMLLYRIAADPALSAAYEKARAEG